MKNITLLIFGLFSIIKVYGQPCSPTVSYYFDGDVLDYSGNANNGVLIADADVSLDYLNIEYNDDDRLELPADALDGIGDFTVVFDFRIDDFNIIGSAPTNTFIAGASAGDEGEFAISYEKSIDAIVVALNGSGEIFDDVTLSEDIWYCLKVIRTGESVSVYIDGDLIGSRDMSGESLDISFLEMGQELDCPAGCYSANQCLNGNIDDFVIFPCAFESSECSAVSVPCDTLLLYDFNSDAEDGSGNAFNGTLNGGANVASNFLQLGYNDDDYIDIPVEALNGATKFSISFNFYLNEFNITGSSPTNTFLAGINGGVEHELALSYEKSSEGFEVAIHNSGGVIPAEIDANKWYCVTFNWMKDTVTIDLNGVTLPGFLVMPNDPIDLTFLEIGQEIDCEAGCFVENQSLNGWMDNLFIRDCVEKIQCSSFPLEIFENNMRDGITIYPNPTSGEIFVEMEGVRENSIIKISDINGTTVYFDPNIKQGQKDIKIMISEFTPGLYIFSVVNIHTGIGVVQSFVKY